MLNFEPKIFGTPEEGVEYVERPGAYGIAIHKDSVLIEIVGDEYFVPGGGIEKGETVEHALKREFLEETGYELASYTNFGTAVEYAYLKNKRYHMKKESHFYLVELGNKGQPSYADGNINPVEWIPSEAIQEKMYWASHWAMIKEALRLSGR